MTNFKRVANYISQGRQGKQKKGQQIQQPLRGAPFLPKQNSKKILNKYSVEIPIKYKQTNIKPLLFTNIKEILQTNVKQILHSLDCTSTDIIQILYKHETHFIDTLPSYNILYSGVYWGV